MAGQEPDLRSRLNAETARIRWTELARHYARGAMITVDPGRDLIEVAEAVARDDTTRVQDWLEQDALRRTSEDEARRWSAGADPEFWCVVVAPWVLVQEICG